MAVYDLYRFQTVEVIEATDAATAAPSSSTDGFITPQYNRVRLLFDYVGTVTACNVQIWFRDRVLGDWYLGIATDDGDALVGSPTSEARDFECGYNAELYFQVESIAGGGTVAVRAQGYRQ
jgi:hypothetical protein